MSDPAEIYDALTTIKDITGNSKIHRAFGQMLFYLTVQQKIADAINKGNKTLSGMHALEYLNMLDGDVVKHIGDDNTAAEKNKLCRAFKREYKAGRRSCEVSKIFGGNTAVIIFVVAENILRHLFGVKKLVGAFGGENLENFCRRGCFEKAVVEKVGSIEVLDNDEEEN